MGVVAIQGSIWIQPFLKWDYGCSGNDMDLSFEEFYMGQSQDFSRGFITWGGVSLQVCFGACLCLVVRKSIKLFLGSYFRRYISTILDVTVKPKVF